MRRETQNILLVLLGGALLKISFTGAYLRYVKPSHQWLLITGGAIMVGLALVSIVRDLAELRKVPAAAPAEHEHSHPARSAWLLLLPVLAVFLVAPPALGADSVQRASSTTTATAPEDGMAVFPPLPPGDVVELPLSDFTARAVWDQDRSVHNRQVRLTGFVVHDGEASYLARVAIACCAADAFPIKIRLTGQDPSDLANDTWIEVVGTLQPGSATKENGHVPTVSVASIERIPQPEDPYEH